MQHSKEQTPFLTAEQRRQGVARILALAEVAVPRQLFAQILGRIARLCPAQASG